MDRIQIIFPLKDQRKNISRIIYDDSYIYYRHNFRALSEVMKYAKMIVNDTGDGEEFELVFYKKDWLEIDELIKQSCPDCG